MALRAPEVGHLMREAVARPFSGTVLTLGEQAVMCDWRDVERIARDAGFALGGAQPRPSPFPALAARGFVSAESVLRALGFDGYETLDVSGHEGAAVRFDLNDPALPEALAGRFSAVLDGGTLEHVFHVPNALRNVWALLAPGGRAIHHSPASNYVDHGFYMFSPTLFWDWYGANGWRVESLQLFRHTRARDSPWELFGEYRPGSLEPVSAGGLDDRIYGVACVATRVPGATADRIPQQSRYRHLWEHGDFAGRAAPPAPPRAGPLRTRLARSPLGPPLRALLRPLRRRRAPAPPLEVVDRY